MIDCRDLSKGHLFFECPTCDFYHLVGLSCHSRFCASCGHKYRDQRSVEIQKKLLKVPHRHFVFSIPYDLRPYFWKCRELFDCLFKTVNEALHFSIQQSKDDQLKDYRLGFVPFLHTSGRELNPHPHIHVLLAEAMH
jgi:transposase-like protein